MVNRYENAKYPGNKRHRHGTESFSNLAHLVCFFDVRAHSVFLLDKSVTCMLVREIMSLVTTKVVRIVSLKVAPS